MAGDKVTTTDKVSGKPAEADNNLVSLTDYSQFNKPPAAPMADDDFQIVDGNAAPATPLAPADSAPGADGQTAGPADVKDFQSLLQLMDNFSIFDSAESKDGQLSLGDLQAAARDPKTADAAQYGIEQFTELSGDKDGIAQTDLRQPLVDALAASMQASVASGQGITPEVQSAIATWVGLRGATQGLPELQTKLNTELEGSGLEVSLTAENVPGSQRPRGVDVQVTKGDETVGAFSYTREDYASANHQTGFGAGGGLFVLDGKETGRTSTSLGNELADAEAAHDLSSNFSSYDANQDGVVSGAEVDAKRNLNPNTAHFASAHSEELGGEQRTGDAAAIGTDVTDVDSPELKQDLAFLQEAFGQPEVTVGSVRSAMERAERQRLSPLSRSSRDGSQTRASMAAGLDQLAGNLDTAQSVSENFDELVEQYSVDADTLDVNRLRDHVNPRIYDPALSSAFHSASFPDVEVGADGTVTRDEVSGEIEQSIKGRIAILDRHREGTESLAKEREQLAAGLERDLFSEVRSMVEPDGAAINLSAMPKEQRAKISFLDGNGDERVSKVELDRYLESGTETLESGREQLVREDRMYQEAMARFESILSNKDELVTATEGDAPAYSREATRAAEIEELAQAVRVSVSENGVRMPVELQEALQTGTGAADSGELVTAVNQALEGTGYQMGFDRARDAEEDYLDTITLFNTENPQDRSSMVHSYGYYRAE